MKSKAAGVVLLKIRLIVLETYKVKYIKTLPVESGMSKMLASDVG